MNFFGLDLDPNNIPAHVAIIMDGNRRWADLKSKSPMSGHREGLERVIDTLEVCEELGVKILTLFAFSTENWKRSNEEIRELMKLFKFFFKREFKKLKKKNIRVIHSGIKDPFTNDIQNIIDTMTDETLDNSSAVLNLAINYSGRLEILEAVKEIARTSSLEEIENLTEEQFSSKLFHPEIPDPDLLIRTSGEQRISNFLLWQIAYTELYYSDVLWPDFSKKDFVEAIFDYQQRERRFGGRNERNP